MPFLAILTLYYFFNSDESDEFKKKVLYIAGGSTVVILIIFFLFGGMIFPFTSENEKLMTEQLIGQIQQANPNAIGLWEGLIKRLDEALILDKLQCLKRIH